MCVVDAEDVDRAGEAGEQPAALIVKMITRRGFMPA